MKSAIAALAVEILFTHGHSGERYYPRVKLEEVELTTLIAEVIRCTVELMISVVPVVTAELRA